jgi:hypothetical protein
MEITQAELKELLHYDPETGIFRRRTSTSNSVKPWDVAGYADGHGYLKCSIKHKLYFMHRLAWLYMTGKWPQNLIDHKNGNGSDNSWLNLREATHQQNTRNRRKKTNTGANFKGVYFDKKQNDWRAYIGLNYKIMHLGRFKTADEAHEAYKAAALKYHGEFARF